jgi:hypothetical protein
MRDEPAGVLDVYWQVRDAAFGEGLSECITIMALVGNKRLGVWQHWIDQSRALMVTHLSLASPAVDDVREGGASR